MNEQADDAQNVALGVLAGLLVLVLAGVIALAVATRAGPAALSAVAEAALPAAAFADPDEPLARIDFAPGSSTLPPDASQPLVEAADAARLQAGSRVLISGFPGTDADAAAHDALTAARLEALRHALEANGVAPERIVVDAPLLAIPGADPAEADRLELRLR